MSQSSSPSPARRFPASPRCSSRPRARGGKVDVAALSAELDSPVALISAAKGTGIDRIQQFLLGTAARLNTPPVRIELPVLQDLPKCRQWAANLGVRASYKAPAPPLW